MEMGTTSGRPSSPEMMAAWTGGTVLKQSETSLAIRGIRVEPPTRTISQMSIIPEDLLERLEGDAEEVLAELLEIGHG
jgi:trimethylamine:corrinoid methyltransferase-like protein